MSRRHRQSLESSTADSTAIGAAHVAPREALKERAAAGEAGGPLQIELPAHQLIRALLAVVGVFVIIQALLLVYRLGFHGQGLVQISALFTLDAEDNLPTAFSTALLIACAMLCAFIGKLETRDRSLRPYWYLLGCVFTFLAADEAVQLHEFVGRLVRRVWVDRGFMQWPWVVPYLAFAAGVAATCAPFLRRLPRSTARECLVAGAVYVMGAGGMDMIEGAVSHAMRNGARHLEPLFLTLPIVEEPLEMIGIILFIAAILRYVADQGDVIRVRVTR